MYDANDNSNPGSDGQELLTPEEAAFKLRVSLDTIYKLIRRGDIPATKVGSQWRIKLRDLNAYLGYDA